MTNAKTLTRHVLSIEKIWLTEFSRTFIVNSNATAIEKWARQSSLSAENSLGARWVMRQLTTMATATNIQASLFILPRQMALVVANSNKNVATHAVQLLAEKTSAVSLLIALNLALLVLFFRTRTHLKFIMGA